MMKIIKVLALLFLSLIMAACDLREVSETVKDTKQIVKESVSEAMKELKLKEMFALESGTGTIELEEPFTGTIYILAAREHISELEKYDFALESGQQFQTIKTSSDDDFNIRFQGETYFSLKRLDVSNLDELTIETDWKKGLVIALREV